MIEVYSFLEHQQMFPEQYISKEEFDKAPGQFPLCFVHNMKKGKTMNDQVVQETVVSAGKPAEFTKLNLDPVAPATQEADAERTVRG